MRRTAPAPAVGARLTARATVRTGRNERNSCRTLAQALTVPTPLPAIPMPPAPTPLHQRRERPDDAPGLAVHPGLSVSVTLNDDNNGRRRRRGSERGSTQPDTTRDAHGSSPRVGVMRELGRPVLAAAAVVVCGAVMTILDSTIVNVAIERLGVVFDARLSTIQWVSTGYLLALAATIPLARLGRRALRHAAGLHGRGPGVRGRFGAVRAGVVGGLADRLPGAAGARRRDGDAGRHDDPRARRGPGADGTRDGARRGADAARARPSDR